MGAIQSMKWLSKQKGKKDNPVKGFVSISCPISLAKASPHLSQWKYMIYANNMTKALLKVAHAHREMVEEKKLDINYGILYL